MKNLNVYKINTNKYKMRKALDTTFIKEVVYSFILYIIGIVLCVNAATSSSVMNSHTSIYGIALFLLSFTVVYVMFIKTCYKHYIISVREFRNVYW